jgi:hypothetical protein
LSCDACFWLWKWFSSGQISKSLPIPNDLSSIEVGDNFDVFVNVENVEGLYGFDLAFVWNNRYIKYVGHRVMAPVEECEDGVLHSPTSG